MEIKDIKRLFYIKLFLYNICDKEIKNHMELLERKKIIVEIKLFVDGLNGVFRHYRRKDQ